MPKLNKIDEVFKLIEETGDRCIVVSEEHDPYVIMDLRSYRTLLKDAAKKQDLSSYSEGELLEHINQQIAEWRETKSSQYSDYDLAQFRVDPPASKKLEDPISNPFSSGIEEKMPLKEPEIVPDNQPRGQINDSDSARLPIIEEEESDEYRLEPLG